MHCGCLQRCIVQGRAGLPDTRFEIGAPCCAVLTSHSLCDIRPIRLLCVFLLLLPITVTLCVHNHALFVKKRMI